MRPQLMLHFAVTGTICPGIARPGTAARASPGVEAGKTVEASRTGSVAGMRSGPRTHPEGKGSILHRLAIAL